ncbi:chemotaxis protein CheW [Oceanirhabdus sp. W0125-5]|uniref:chemotaxis protein CheW n=1 Tax=Oceanirhabdus sp. W0125-5 TaxID=2999116 RepID=UPI0022F31D5A|nr:chemotaxis protein CheW [Oceanirhabdus sp. W0125-5]WBW95477.1 chemotaxis protein CheW [Oceanirhabdus sp. W0125-5]
MQVIIFNLGEEQFAVKTEVVQNITDMMEVTRVPKAPKYIKGLINLRGNVISLLDLNLLLDVKGKKEEHDSTIIIKIGDEAVGIAVDTVEEVLDIDESIIENIEDNRDKKYIKGVLNFNDRIVTLIDVGRLIN